MTVSHPNGPRKLSNTDVRDVLRVLLAERPRLAFNSRPRAFVFGVTELLLFLAAVVGLGVAMDHADDPVDLSWYFPVLVAGFGLMFAPQGLLVRWSITWKPASSRRPRGLAMFWWAQLAINDLAKAYIAVLGGALLWLILEVHAEDLQPELVAAVFAFVFAALGRVAWLYVRRRRQLLHELGPFLATVRQGGAPSKELSTVALLRLVQGLATPDSPPVPVVDVRLCELGIALLQQGPMSEEINQIFDLALERLKARPRLLDRRWRDLSLDRIRQEWSSGEAGIGPWEAAFLQTLLASGLAPAHELVQLVCVTTQARDPTGDVAHFKALIDQLRQDTEPLVRTYRFLESGGMDAAPQFSAAGPPPRWP